MRRKEAAAREENRRRLYVADMVVAQQAWEAANVGRVRELIARHFPGPGQTDLRGFQWYYLWRLCEQIRKVPTLSRSQRRSIWSLAFSPDSETLASGSLDGTDHALGRSCAQSHAVPSRWTRRVVSTPRRFTPDGTTLVSVGATVNGGEVRIWDVRDHGAATHATYGDFPSHPAAVSPDGTTLAWGDLAGAVYACDLEASDQPETLDGQHARWVTSLAFSPDGRTLVTGSSDCHVNLWDVQTRKLRQTLTGHESWVRSVAISPDGTTIASAGQDKTVRLWDLQSGQPKKTLVHEGRLWSVAFSPDGETLVTAGSDGRVKLVGCGPRDRKELSDRTRQPFRLCGRLVSRREDRGFGRCGCENQIVGRHDEPVARDTLIGHRQAVISLAISLDGNTLASAACDRTIKLWDTRTGALLHTFLGHTGWVTSVAISRDGATLASAGDDYMLKLWDVKTGDGIETAPGRARALVDHVGRFFAR